jgi:glycosyltransferase involved in cell wall biosynthesis
MNDPKSILFVDQYAAMGGGQQILIDSIQAFLDEGFSVGVFVPGGGELVRRLESQFGSRVELVTFNEWKFTQGKKHFFDYIKLLVMTIAMLSRRNLFRKFYYVHCNGGRLFLPCALLSKLIPKTKFSYHIHIEPGWSERKLIRWISDLRGTNRVVFISDFLHSRWIEKEGALPKAVIVGNALPASYSDVEIDSRRFVGATTYNLAVIGRISPEKGQDTLLQLLDRFENLRLHVVGGSDFASGIYADELKRKGEGKIIFHGKTQNIRKSISEIPIHFSLVPSRWEEPFGLVAIESMAASCVTIVRATGGLKEIAEKSGAITFNKDEELPLILQNLLEKNPHALDDIVRSQFEKTIANYRPAVFRKSLVRAMVGT